MSIDTLNNLVEQWRADGDAPGVVALKALDYCLADQQEVPAWVLETINDCWHLYSNGTPVTGWENEVQKNVLGGNVPKSLDEAFGIKERGMTAKQNAKLKYYGPKIYGLITDGRFSKTQASFKEIADWFGITKKQAEKWYYDYLKSIPKISKK